MARLWWKTAQWLLRESKISLPCDAATSFQRELKEAVAYHMTSRNQEADPHFLGWRNNQDVVCLYSGILFALPKEGELDSHCNLNES